MSAQTPKSPKEQIKKELEKLIQNLGTYRSSSLEQSIFEKNYKDLVENLEQLRKDADKTSYSLIKEKMQSYIDAYKKELEAQLLIIKERKPYKKEDFEEYNRINLHKETLRILYFDPAQETIEKLIDLGKEEDPRESLENEFKAFMNDLLTQMRSELNLGATDAAGNLKVMFKNKAQGGRDFRNFVFNHQTALLHKSFIENLEKLINRKDLSLAKRKEEIDKLVKEFYKAQDDVPRQIKNQILYYRSPDTRDLAAAARLEKGDRFAIAKYLQEIHNQLDDTLGEMNKFVDRERELNYQRDVIEEDQARVKSEGKELLALRREFVLAATSSPSPSKTPTPSKKVETGTFFNRVFTRGVVKEQKLIEPPSEKPKQKDKKEELTLHSSAGGILLTDLASEYWKRKAGKPDPVRMNQAEYLAQAIRVCNGIGKSHDPVEKKDAKERLYVLLGAYLDVRDNIKSRFSDLKKLIDIDIKKIKEQINREGWQLKDLDKVAKEKYKELAAYRRRPKIDMENDSGFTASGKRRGEAPEPEPSKKRDRLG